MSVVDDPLTMEAIVQRAYGRPRDVLEPAVVERPVQGDDEVLIAVKATSVNTPDWVTVTGVPKVLRLQFGIRRPRTSIRGTDVAGIVEAVGANVTDLEVGDEVFGSAWANSISTRAGTFAQYSVAPASQLVRKPAFLSFEEAAASVMSGLTALIAMKQVAAVGPGTTVLVNGASGGVGLFAVQIAKALGAEVTGVCSTRNLDLVRVAGADRVVDYTFADFTRGDARYDVILDNVLNHPPSQVARALAPKGVLIPNSVGSDGGWFAGLPRMGRAVLLRLRSTDVRFATCVVNRENLQALLELIEIGAARVILDDVYPMARAAEAVEHMLSHRARGKIVVSQP